MGLKRILIVLALFVLGLGAAVLMAHVPACCAPVDAPVEVTVTPIPLPWLSREYQALFPVWIVAPKATAQP